jgi:hypothetical protein
VTDKKAIHIVCAAHDPGAVNDILPVVENLHRHSPYKVACYTSPFGNKAFREIIPTVSVVENNSPASIREMLESGPALVVITGMSAGITFEETFVAEAKKMDIPTISITNLVSLELTKNIFDKRYDLRLLPDFLIVPNQITKEYLKKDGVEESRILVLGNPHFDEVFACAGGSAPVDPDKVKTILFVSQPFSELYGQETSIHMYGYTEQTVFRDVTVVLNSICKKPHPRFGLVVRCHPKESKGKFSAISAEFNIGFENNKSAIEQIQESDVVLGMRSTMLFEAAILGKPVISYQPDIKNKGLYFDVFEMLANVAFSKNALEELVSELLIGTGKKTSNETVLREMNIDGGAVGRIVGFVGSMVGRER